MSKSLTSFLKEPTDSMLVSYRILRLAIGWMGVLLPVGCIVGNWAIYHCPGYQYSISAYFYTGMRTYFTGTLCAVSVFLFAYRGPQRMDAWVGNLAGLFALGVAFFPMNVPSPYCVMCNGDAGNKTTDILHTVSAALFFLSLVVFCFFLFTKSGGNPTKRKKTRNGLYVFCGTMMCLALSVILLVDFSKSVEAKLLPYHPVYWSELTALVFFGISWLTKAELLFADKKK